MNEECILCGEEITEDQVANVDPWFRVHGYMHRNCYDNHEPSDRQGEAPVTERERYEAAWRQKRELSR